VIWGRGRFHDASTSDFWDRDRLELVSKAGMMSYWLMQGRPTCESHINRDTYSNALEGTKGQNGLSNRYWTPST
jgi:hypothetical protein